ncbi:putative FlaG/YvyC family protein [Bradyrhizobium sp. LM2.7]
MQIVTTSNAAANEAVQTDLPVNQTVAASDTSAAVRNNLHCNENVSRQVVFDQAAASFVFQVVNDRTEAVVNQFPDEAMLRRRAYFHALDLKSEPSRPLNTDLSA